MPVCVRKICMEACRVWHVVKVSPQVPRARSIKPQLTRLVEETATGDGTLRDISKDGHGMNTGNEGRDSKLLTRTGLDWSNHYRRTNEALAKVAR